MSLITLNNGLKTVDIDAQEQIVDMMESMLTFKDKADKSADKELAKTVLTFKEVMVKMEKNMTLLMDENILLKKQLIKLESDKTANEVLHQQEKKASDELVTTLIQEVKAQLGEVKKSIKDVDQRFLNHTHNSYSQVIDMNGHGQWTSVDSGISTPSGQQRKLKLYGWSEYGQRKYEILPLEDEPSKL